ncbi:hypothetical protein PanWU01x14_271270 [Parasponia andersonii]|uniref:Uncharacterized protein n=1 Tax=Parasponia andersonii TaxID=3476 RepID=A0A2P5B4N8_PARAD|nr:hypothetical protein PanWU01x14_271270 [Parasponia andersonii]
MAWSTAWSNGSDSAQLSELTQFVAANFRRLVRTPIGLILAATLRKKLERILVEEKNLYYYLNCFSFA